MDGLEIVFVLPLQKVFHAIFMLYSLAPEERGRLTVPKLKMCLTMPKIDVFKKFCALLMIFCQVCSNTVLF